jgi:hypothetical protein
MSYQPINQKLTKEEVSAIRELMIADEADTACAKKVLQIMRENQADLLQRRQNWFNDLFTRYGIDKTIPLSYNDKTESLESVPPPSLANVASGNQFGVVPKQEPESSN